MFPSSWICFLVIRISSGFSAAKLMLLVQECLCSYCAYFAPGYVGISSGYDYGDVVRITNEVPALLQKAINYIVY